MCGIAGSIGHDPSVVGNILLHQKKRGPDFINWEQIELNPFNVVLGHNRLSIIDLSNAGNQPMHTNRYSLTYNGEIYNYKELGSQGNDSRVLLHYISAKGIDQALKDINGMYAFGAYDSHRHELTLAVDRFGQKPLYYYHKDDKFVFASSPGALLNLENTWKIDDEALQSYWLLGSVMGENSMFSGIKKLTGSHVLTYNCYENSVKVRRYWQPEYQNNTAGIEDLVLDAINKVKVADVPVHLFLSGGIDSTLVASQCSGMDAIHLDSPELIYAQEAAQKFNINLKNVSPVDVDIEECLSDYALQCGEPSMAALIPYITAKEVSKFGKVAISANGADELFFGYDRTPEQTGFKQQQHIFRASAFGVIHRYVSDGVYDRISSGRWLELNSYVQFDLNKTLDNASMCHSLEVRAPFLDHRLVEMALSIPESQHRAPHNKTILKNMLRQMGFNDHFLNRPKLGFSLHKKPENMQDLISKAWRWVKTEGFLNVDEKKLTGRDLIYLQMSALSFYYWIRAWQHKLSLS